MACTLTAILLGRRQRMYSTYQFLNCDCGKGATIVAVAVARELRPVQ